MMQMESVVPLQSSDFPSAIVLARLADVVVNNNVLYRMVQPTEQGTEVVSVNRMVNVVPFRRVYRFDRKEELNEFCDELLKRPLVMQPVVHLGRGLGSGSLSCGLCYKDDKWIMMVNQTHPKILGRLQIGLDAARNAIARGQSCEIRFAFSKMVEKIYKEQLTRAEQENTAQAMDLIKSYFRYAEWEYGDLIIRYHGYLARFGRGGGFFDQSTLNLTFMFEDLMTPEISWKTMGAEFFPKPHLAPVTEDEIRERLPAWTVNDISPLEDIGENVPTANYSYAQAGRLYESFRKKKRRPPAEMGDHASGGAPMIRPTVTDGIELKVIGHDDGDEWRQQSPRGGRYGEENLHQHREYREGSYDDREDYNRIRPQHAAQQWQGYAEDDGFYEGKGAKPKRGPQYDHHGNLYPEVKVNSVKPRKPGNDDHPNAGPLPTSYPYTNITPTVNSYGNMPHEQMSSPHSNSSQKDQAANPYAHPSPRQNEHEYSSLKNQFSRLHMQGSDRSSHSETGSGVADSGICSDSDGHVRESSYDKPYPSVQKKNSPTHLYAMDNHGFHDDEADMSDALRKHKELVAKMMGGAQLPAAEPGRVRQNSGYEDSYESGYQQRLRSASSDRDAADHFSRNVAGPRHAKGGPPSPLSLQGQHYDPMDGRNTQYRQVSYSPNAQNTSTPMEESFI